MFQKDKKYLHVVYIILYVSIIVILSFQCRSSIKEKISNFMNCSIKEDIEPRDNDLFYRISIDSTFHTKEVRVYNELKCAQNNDQYIFHYAEDVSGYKFSKDNEEEYELITYSLPDEYDWVTLVKIYPELLTEDYGWGLFGEYINRIIKPTKKRLSNNILCVTDNRFVKAVSFSEVGFINSLYLHNGLEIRSHSVNDTRDYMTDYFSPDFYDQKKYISEVFPFNSDASGEIIVNCTDSAIKSLINKDIVVYSPSEEISPSELKRQALNQYKYNLWAHTLVFVFLIIGILLNVARCCKRRVAETLQADIPSPEKFQSNIGNNNATIEQECSQGSDTITKILDNPNLINSEWPVNDVATGLQKENLHTLVNSDNLGKRDNGGLPEHLSVGMNNDNIFVSQNEEVMPAQDEKCDCNHLPGDRYETNDLAGFVTACEDVNIELMQTLYETCPTEVREDAREIDCTRLFRESILRQIDKLESFIDETDIAKIQQIKESFFDKATDATRKKFALEFQRAEEILSEFEAEYGSGVPIMDISTEVNYSLKSTLDHKYPYRKVPVLGTRIFPYRRQRALRKGVSEEKFYKLICKYLSFPGFIILDDVSLHINEGLAIEPDIAIIINRQKNIRIDVEIDEPYSGYDHKPIHYIGCGDEIRDDNLAKLGWITLRFAEEQVVGSPLCVIAEILRIINMIDYDSYSGQRLNAEIAKRGEKLIRISRWTKDEAIEMAEKRYREEYLNLSAFGEVLIQLPQEYHQTIAEKKALEGVSLSSTNSGVLVNKDACPISEAYIQKKEVPPCESILEGKDKVDVTSQEYSMAQPVNLASIIDRPVPGKRKREELPYFSIRPKSVSTTELIQYYFPLKSAEVSGSDIITEESLNTELYDFYNRGVDKSYSAEFLILQEYIKDNDIHPRNVFMRLYDPKYNVSSSISFIDNDALYSCRLKSISIPDSERGRGIAAGLENIPRNRIDVEETMKALILSERYNMSVKQIYIIEIDPKSMSINKRKAMPQTTGKNILFGDYWDQVKQIKDGNN